MRKGFLLTMAIMLAALGAGATRILASDDSPELIAVSVTFDTTSNDKDHDTLLDVTVYNNRGKLLGRSTGISGHWNDHSRDEIGLNLVNRLTRDDIPGGRLTLTIHPNGNDKWEFNAHVTLTFDDESEIEKTFNGKVLTQDNPSVTLTWNGQ
jgi:hypothetical protein